MAGATGPPRTSLLQTGRCSGGSETLPPHSDGSSGNSTDSSWQDDEARLGGARIRSGLGRGLGGSRLGARVPFPRWLAAKVRYAAERSKGGAALGSGSKGVPESTLPDVLQVSKLLPMRVDPELSSSTDGSWHRGRRSRYGSSRADFGGSWEAAPTMGRGGARSKPRFCGLKPAPIRIARPRWHVGGGRGAAAGASEGARAWAKEAASSTSCRRDCASSPACCRRAQTLSARWVGF
mmetsp:Transcript_135408/g.433015  ORF Transcript_135408/g.433015 Transcript_135408/m.433015 type:complete len:236 (+) Transcript_135408:460-1167(+)